MHYFPFRPAEKIVASWTAAERVDQNNGCLYVIPGSHKGPLYEHTYPNVRVDDSFTHKVLIKFVFQGIKNKLYHGVQGLDHLKKHYVVMDKGDTVFFHPHLLHGSGPNRTQVFTTEKIYHWINKFHPPNFQGFRKAISCHYADSNCYFVDVRGSIQEEVAKEIESQAKRYGIEDPKFEVSNNILYIRQNRVSKNL